MNGIERGPYGAQYLVSGPADSVETAYQMDIMMQARPDCLLPVYRQATGRGCRYAYPVTGLASLADRVAAGVLDAEQAARLVEQLRQDLDGLPDRLLAPGQVLLKPEALFLEPDARRLLLVYQPFLPAERTDTIDDLTHWLGERLCRNRRQKRRWAARFHNGPAADQSAPAAVAEPPTVPGMTATEKAARSLKRALPNVSMPVIACLVAGAAMSALIWALSRNGLPDLGRFAGLAFTERVLRLTGSGRFDWRMALLTLLAVSIPVQLILFRRKRQDTAAEPVDLRSLAVRLDPVPVLKKAAAAFRRKTSESPASQERMHDMPTELLSSRQELFRLATLSEGMIGSKAETAGQRAFILNDEFLVGRDFRTVDLCLTGYAVGRQHARIMRQGAAFFITDLGSKNGTRLNGERLNKMQPYLLPDHCQLQFADRLFYFEAEPLPVSA